MIYLCAMEEGKKNLIGDLIMSTTIGCVLVLSFLATLGLIGVSCLFLLSILKPLF